MEFPLAVCSEIKLHYLATCLCKYCKHLIFLLVSTADLFQGISEQVSISHLFLLLFCFKLSLCQKEKKLLQQQRQQQQRQAEEQQHRLCFLWRLCAKLISILLLSDWDLNGVRSAALAAPHEINLQCEKNETKKKNKKHGENTVAGVANKPLALTVAVAY